MKTAYKVRFIPLSVTLFAFIVLLVIRFGARLPISDRTLWWSGGLTFAAFIFLQAMRENERDKRKKAEEPVLTEAEIKTKEIHDEITLHSGNNIPIASVKLAFAVVVTACSATMLSSDAMWWGLFGVSIGVVTVVVYVRRLRWYIRRLRELKSGSEHDL